MKLLMGATLAMMASEAIARESTNYIEMERPKRYNPFADLNYPPLQAPYRKRSRLSPAQRAAIEHVESPQEKQERRRLEGLKILKASEAAMKAAEQKRLRKQAKRIKANNHGVYFDSRKE